MTLVGGGTPSIGRRSGWLSGNPTGDWMELGPLRVMVLQMGSKIPVWVLGAPSSAGGVVGQRLSWWDDGSVLTHEGLLWSVRMSSHVATGQTPLLHVQILLMGTAIGMGRYSRHFSVDRRAIRLFPGRVRSRGCWSSIDMECLERDRDAVGVLVGQMLENEPGGSVLSVDQVRRYHRKHRLL
ncbi:hypothetical protein NE237_022794 [Protea cynaroides]|uniref:Uncharacterized protein n=1 Tax=Protea cynaroides TaxID=273540 RepID=A0A9Q0K5L5_9MAGN|nr:hypothetical protein NE237_022794 [Protea cynaroides]